MRLGKWQGLHIISRMKKSAKSTSIISMKPSPAARVISAANFYASAADKRLRECMANPTCKCVIASALSFAQSAHSAAALHDIALVQAEMEDVDGAFTTARIMREGKARAETLRDVASARVCAGDMQSARSIYAAALSAAQSIDFEHSRIEVLCGIALTQVRAGCPQWMSDTFAAALSVAQSVDNAEALRGIAEAQAKAGAQSSARDTFAVARSVAQSIDGEDSRTVSLQNIAVAQAEFGYAGDAIALVQIFDDMFDRIQSLCLIVSVQTDSDDLQLTQDALVVALRGADSAECRDDALHAIALAQAKSGNIHRAVSTVQNIDSTVICVDALRAIALEEDKKSARKTLIAAQNATRNIDDANDRDKALCDIALAQAEMMNIDDALSAVKSIGGRDCRDRALCGVALARAEMGNVDDALSVVESIGGGDCRDKVLRNVALIQAGAGDIDGAFYNARRIASTNCRAKALYGIAEAQVKKGNIAAALSIASSARKDSDLYVEFMRTIAVAQAKLGNFQDMLKTAMDIEENEVRARALAAVAKYLATRKSGNS